MVPLAPSHSGVKNRAMTALALVILSVLFCDATL